MAVPENAYSLHITHHAAINALLSLLLPRWGVSAPSFATQGVASLRSLALGWVLITPPGCLWSAWLAPTHTVVRLLHAWPAPCHSLEMRMKRLLRAHLLHIR